MKKYDRFDELDGMRGVLALTVMLYHFGLNTVLQTVTGGFIRNGEWGLSVDFFFMLSGFVLAKSFSGGGTSYYNYFVKRAFRLWPMFFVTTIFTMIVVPIRNDELYTIAANFLMLHSLFGLAAINGPAWSIPFEFILPVLGILFLKYRPAMSYRDRWAALMTFTLVSIAATYLLALKVDLPWVRALSGLGTGFFLYRFFSVSKRTSGEAVLSTMSFFIAFLCMMFSGNWPMVALLFSPFSCLAIYYGANVRGLFSSELFQIFGRWSYSIYLVHLPILHVFLAAFGYDGMKGSVSLKAALVVLSITISAICYLTIEKSGIALGARILARRKPKSSALSG